MYVLERPLSAVKTGVIVLTGRDVHAGRLLELLLVNRNVDNITYGANKCVLYTSMLRWHMEI